MTAYQAARKRQQRREFWRAMDQVISMFVVVVVLGVFGFAINAEFIIAYFK